MSRYVAIRSEGGLIPFDTIDKILQEELPGQKPADFNLPTGRRVSDDISRAWSDALDYWRIFKRRVESLDEDDPGTTVTRRWMTELTDLLGYEQLTLQRGGSQIGGKPYPISHRAGDGVEAPPVHIVGFRQSLDRRDESGHRRMSPQALVQEFLNRSEHLWGIVTNGLRFRLLRDTTRMERPTYLEFDLQSILEGGRYNEFAAFYRLCHRTRLPKAISDAPSSLLERYYQASMEEGTRVRDRLRDGVEEALMILGNGLLRYPDNDELRTRVRSGELTAADYYRQLLRLIYRLLFLMVAEERQMIAVGPGLDDERRQRIYDEHYSLRRLRDLAEQPIEGESPYGDLWIRLQRTFALFTNGRENALGIPPLNGDLFGPTAIPDVERTSLYNHDLLLAMRHLSVFREAGAPARINYAGLDVEELGSVYESLLDYQPAIGRQNGSMAFALLEGTERKSTGSYYTPDELVTELVEGALVPVLEDRLSRAKTLEDKERAILTLTVCDPASGSGHFLLAAARRLARELAKVRTGEEEPTPDDFRRALRDVIRNCLYAVDLNPLAVDLCKLALWIEGHDVGLPLTFLDHKVKCGNSLLGVLSTHALAEGVPDDAFKPVADDDKAIASTLRNRNAADRKAIAHQVQLFVQRVEDRAELLARTHTELTRLPEVTVKDIREKERRYQEVHGRGSSWWKDWTAANLWTSAFFLPLTKQTGALTPTTADLRALLEQDVGDERKMDTANGLSQQLRFFQWPLEFSEVFVAGGFDAILTNPPWGQKEVSLDPRLRKFILTRHPSSAGIFDMFRPFLDLGVRLLKSGGMFGAVLPDILLLKNYEESRKFLLEATAMLAIGWWPQPFPDATIDVITLTLRKEQPPEAQRVKAMVHDPQAPLETEIFQAEFRENPRYTFNLFITPRKRQLIQHLNQFPRLGSFFEVHEGVHSGNIRGKLFIGSRLDESCKELVIRGEEVRPYEIHWAGNFIRLGAMPKNRTGKEYANIGRHEWHARPKVVVRRTGDSVIAAVDENGRYFSNNFFVVFPSQICGLDLFGLCALLNTKLMTWFFRTIEPREGRVFAEIKIKHLRDFPLPLNAPGGDRLKTLNELGYLRARAQLGIQANRQAGGAQPTESQEEVLDEQSAHLLARIEKFVTQLFAIPTELYDDLAGEVGSHGEAETTGAVR